MGCLLNELLMVGLIRKVMMLSYGDFCRSTLTILIVMKYNIFWSLSLAYASTLVLFPLSVVICNHLIVSVMMLLNWLQCLSDVCNSCILWHVG